MFADQEIGELQNITIEEGYDLKILPEIGSNYSVAFIPGVFRGVVRAQKGILDITDLINKIIPYSSKSSIIDYISNITKDIANIKGFMSINDTFDFLFSHYEENLKEKSYPLVYSFNVEIKDIDGKVFQKLEDCTINTRRVSINSGNLLILQDIELFYRKRTI